MVLAVVATSLGTLSDVVPAQSQGQTLTTSDTLGATARQAMIDIFRKRDATAVGRYFGASFIQHDPTLADGVAESMLGEIYGGQHAARLVLTRFIGQHPPQRVLRGPREAGISRDPRLPQKRIR